MPRFREDQLARGAEVNFGPIDIDVALLPHGGATDDHADAGESPGVNAFVREDDAAFHTYSTYARGTDGLRGMCRWLDRTPLGRNESGPWFRRHDEYAS